MRKLSFKNIVLAGLVGILVSSSAYGAPPTFYNSGTAIYDVSGYAGTCEHVSTLALDSCDQASSNQAGRAAFVENVFPQYYEAFECPLGSVAKAQIGHVWTGFTSVAATQLFKDYYQGGILAPHPILQAIFYAVDSSGIMNNNVPEPYGTAEQRYTQGNPELALVLAQTLRGMLQTALAAAFPVSGGPGLCIFEHPGMWFKYNYNNPQLSLQPWWGLTAKTVSDTLFDLSKSTAGCQVSSPLAANIKNYIGCVGF